MVFDLRYWCVFEIRNPFSGAVGKLSRNSVTTVKCLTTANNIDWQTYIKSWCDSTLTTDSICRLPMEWGNDYESTISADANHILSNRWAYLQFSLQWTMNNEHTFRTNRRIGYFVSVSVFASIFSFFISISKWRWIKNNNNNNKTATQSCVHGFNYILNRRSAFDRWWFWSMHGFVWKSV